LPTGVYVIGIAKLVIIAAQSIAANTAEPRVTVAVANLSLIFLRIVVILLQYLV
jgi:hypothetical protein